MHYYIIHSSLEFDEVWVEGPFDQKDAEEKFYDSYLYKSVMLELSQFAEIVKSKDGWFYGMYENGRLSGDSHRGTHKGDIGTYLASVSDGVSDSHLVESDWTHYQIDHYFNGHLPDFDMTYYDQLQYAGQDAETVVRIRRNKYAGEIKLLKSAKNFIGDDYYRRWKKHYKKRMKRADRRENRRYILEQT